MSSWSHCSLPTLLFSCTRLPRVWSLTVVIHVVCCKLFCVFRLSHIPSFPIVVHTLFFIYLTCFIIVSMLALRFQLQKPCILRVLPILWQRVSVPLFPGPKRFCGLWKMLMFLVLRRSNPRFCCGCSYILHFPTFVYSCL